MVILTDLEGVSQAPPGPESLLGDESSEDVYCLTLPSHGPPGSLRKVTLTVHFLPV